MKTLPLMLMVLVGCGGSHVIGRDFCSVSSCGEGAVCDYDGACRTYCGPNYPGVVCPSGTACAGFVCRPTCSDGSCANGTCQQFQTNNGVTGICSATVCRSGEACPAGQACVGGSCQVTGQSCPDGVCGSQSQVCSDGVCRVRCGSDFPGCTSGTSCQNGLCR